MSCKNILVTGASKGLGLMITQKLLRNKYNVYAINRTSSEPLLALKEQYKDNLKVLFHDLSSPELVKEDVFKKFISSKVPLYGYINNAAFAYDDIITNISLEKLEKMYKVNVFSPIMISKYAIRNMLLHRMRGCITHVSSISVHTGYKGLAMYASTKGALEAFSKNTAREWGKLGIRSNCIVAGFMETDMSASLSEEQRGKIFERTSLKSATSKDSVAESILFLLSDGAVSITGQNIFVDNGTI